MSAITIAPPADIAIAVTGPARAADDSEFRENIVVSNKGPSAATNTVADLLVPAGVTVTSAPGASRASGTLAWGGVTLPPGTAVSYTATFTVADGVHATTVIGGFAESAGYDANLANNDAITTNPSRVDRARVRGASDARPTGLSGFGDPR
jgi:Domain of unknown function DUF11